MKKITIMAILAVLTSVGTASTVVKRVEKPKATKPESKDPLIKQGKVPVSKS